MSLIVFCAPYLPPLCEIVSHQVKITADINGFINEHHDHTWNIHGCKVRIELCGSWDFVVPAVGVRHVSRVLSLQPVAHGSFTQGLIVYHRTQ
jgi:hypothetical protein